MRVCSHRCFDLDQSAAGLPLGLASTTATVLTLADRIQLDGSHERNQARAATGGNSDHPTLRGRWRRDHRDRSFGNAFPKPDRSNPAGIPRIRDDRDPRPGYRKRRPDPVLRCNGRHRDPRQTRRPAGTGWRRIIRWCSTSGDQPDRGRQAAWLLRRRRGVVSP